MISPIISAIIFLVYSLLTLITFYVFSLKNGYINTNALKFIYVYYTVLTFYVLFIFDVANKLIYVIIKGSFFSIINFLITYYFYTFKIKKDKKI